MKRSCRSKKAGKEEENVDDTQETKRRKQKSKQ